jgi:hypothetical protein
MQMTEAFASTVAVTVPIFALAAGAEARGIRERLRRPDPQWEQEFAAYNAEHELDLGQAPSEVFAFLKDIPGVSAAYKVERALAIAGGVVWLVVFLLLGITEMRCLIWLADGATPGDPGLAQFSAVSIGLAMFTLIVAPVVYLLVPIGLSVDLIPKGLKQAVGPKLGDSNARGFVKQVLTELEGAVERASDNYAEKKPAETADREPPQEPGQYPGGGPSAEASGPNAST